MSATYLTREERLAVLRETPFREAISIESLLDAGFPVSAMYPAFWSGANAGSRLAFSLDCRVIFSHKLLTITLVPMDDDDRRAKLNCFERVKRMERQKTADRLATLRKLRGKPTLEEVLNESSETE